VKYVTISLSGTQSHLFWKRAEKRAVDVNWMNLDKVIEELKREKNSITEAIVALERLLPGNNSQLDAADGTVKRPGRPPGSKNQKSSKSE
jgi:hypothetical protein